MKPDIRPATAEDYETISEVLGQVDAFHRDALPHVFRKPDGPARDPEYILAALADANTGLFVAEAAGRLVGVIHVALRESPPAPIFVPRRYAVIDSLAVHEAHRGKGIGAALIATAEAWARAKGAGAVELHVWEFNASAIAFYERLGYEMLSRKMGKALNEGS